MIEGRKIFLEEAHKDNWKLHPDLKELFLRQFRTTQPKLFELKDGV